MNNFAQEPCSGETTLLSISTILNSLDAAVYVADLDTHKMIFMNKFAIENWGENTGSPCYSIMQKGQDQPCEFCTNHLLVDEAGEPTGVHVWQFQNTINNNWYECRDQAIRWIDGRLVRMEIAIDITKRKEMESSIQLAKQYAEKRASTDELTQARNRRAFFEDSERLLKESEGLASLIMIDVDYFKLINDKYGHIAGDTVLKKLSELIEKNIRKKDVFGRVGGEEFAIFISDVDLDTAPRIAKELREKINQYEINIDNIPLKISCSFGVVTLKDATLDEMYKYADDALYTAKNNGRNRVEIYKI